MNNIEQTLSIIKPDAVERNLDNEIKEMFKNKGFYRFVYFHNALQRSCNVLPGSTIFKNISL